MLDWSSVAAKSVVGLYMRRSGGRWRPAPSTTLPGLRTWDQVFAGLFLTAHDADLAGEQVVRPWQLAFDAAADYTDLLHILLA